ncbi:DUF4959 domain-containing protein [Puteibacter caeruleilacunae]|nr:DUF4959 domain-containing protein [Puteibacter caeruleilacunae]
MKNIKIIYIAMVAVIMAISCSEDEHNPLFSDTMAPGPITSPVITNLPGAAVITYDAPSDEDFLYVKAKYTMTNGEEAEARSSNFINNVKVEGFGDTKEQSVQLIAVDRSENESEPVTVTINPLNPDVHEVLSSVVMVPDFGGVQYTWDNTNNAALSFAVLATDSLGELSEVETVYSGVTEGNYTVRGFEPEEKEFGIVIRDRWDNYSDTMKLALTPMKEDKLDKSKFENFQLDDDNDMNAWEGKYKYTFDDNIKTFNHTWAGDGWPQKFTVDLGVTARLSRVIVVQRQNFPYAHGNPRLLEVWGTKETPSVDGNMDNWTKLRDCVAIKPSELGGTSAEDQEHLKNGDEYSFTLEDPEVRYIRFIVNETWGLTGFIHFGEVTFYGQVTSGNE